MNEIAVGFRYKVHIAGVNHFDDAGFSDISGISSELETENVNVGGDNSSIYSLPTHIKHTDLVLKRGFLTLGSKLADWVKEIMTNGFANKIKTEDVIVHLVNEHGDPVIEWTFYNAFPVKWEVSGFNAMENKVVLESVSLRYTNFDFNFS